MVYIKINNQKYEAKILAKVRDEKWDYRESLSIKIKKSYEEVISIFANNINFFTVYEPEPKIDTVTQELITFDKIETDCSEYSVLGDITVHPDGYVTVKMGKPTAEEMLLMLQGVIG